MLFIFFRVKLFESSCVNLSQSNLMSKTKTENLFWAAPSSVVWIRAVRLCIQFDEMVYLLVQVLYLKLS